MTPVLEVEEPSTSSPSLSAYGKAKSTIQGSPLSSEELRKTHAYWRACNYLALGMIYLQANPLLKEALSKHVDSTLTDAFPFEGRRCERMTSAVFQRLGLPA